MKELILDDIADSLEVGLTIKNSICPSFNCNSSPKKLYDTYVITNIIEPDAYYINSGKIYILDEVE